MAELIPSTRAAPQMSATSNKDNPVDITPAEIAEASQDELISKINLARERAKSCERRMGGAISAGSSLRQQLAAKPPLADEDGAVEQYSDIADSLADWHDSFHQSTFAFRDFSDAVEQVVAGVRSHVPEDRSHVDESHGEFYDKISDALEGLDKDWLANYGDALKKYIEFFSEFNNIMAELQKYITASSDGQKVEIRFFSVRSALSALLTKYAAQGEGLASFPSKVEAEKFIADLGLGGLTIKESNGRFEVMIDLSPVESLRDSMPTPGGLPLPVEWDMARYNAWLSGKDSYTEQLQHVSKVLGEKYARNLQTFDNLVKVLSSTIDSIGETDRMFASNLV